MTDPINKKILRRTPTTDNASIFKKAMEEIKLAIATIIIRTMKNNAAKPLDFVFKIFSFKKKTPLSI